MLSRVMNRQRTSLLREKSPGVNSETELLSRSKFPRDRSTKKVS
jgi:hypothetical protein